MTNWTARIDALLMLAEPMTVEGVQRHYERRLALAAERLREPHRLDCAIGWPTTDCDVPAECTCGLVADVLKILEGK